MENFEKLPQAFTEAYNKSKRFPQYTWYIWLNMETDKYVVAEEPPVEAWERLKATYNNGIRTTIATEESGTHCKQVRCVKRGEVLHILGDRARIEHATYSENPDGSTRITLQYVVAKKTEEYISHD